MAEIKYSCNRCRRTFDESAALSDGNQQKCPFCDSGDIKKTSKILEFLNSIMYAGGG
jgi:putative FmdB family regulatory protein